MLGPGESPADLQPVPFEGGPLGLPDPASAVAPSQTITAWHILTYPIQTLQSRLLCARYLSVLTVPVFPDYPGGSIPTSHAAAAANKGGAAGTVFESRRGVPLLVQQPLLLSSCHLGALNVFALLAHAMRVVYEAEGVPGLFRGLVPSCLHRLYRDCLHWALLRYCYKGTVSLSSTAGMAIGWMLRPFKRKNADQSVELVESCISSKDSSSSRMNSISDVRAIGTVREIAEADVNEASPFTEGQLQRHEESFAGIDLMPPILLKLAAEVASYPLLVVATRLSVIESHSYPLESAVYLPRGFSLSCLFSFCVELMTSQVVVGASEMFYLTLHADGFGAFWRGAFPFLLSRSVDEVVSLVCFFSSRSRSSRTSSGRRKGLEQQQQGTAAAATTATTEPHQAGPSGEESSVDSRLLQLEDYTRRAWLSAILGTAAAPLAQLSVIQRCQSNIEGLCEYRPWLTLLSGMPWKPLMVQFGVCCLFLAISGAVLATSHKRLSTVEREEEEENLL